MTSPHSGEIGPSCATIMARLAAVLRDPVAHITNMDSAVAKAGVPRAEISLQFGSTRELLHAMTSELTERMSAPLAVTAVHGDLRKSLLEFGDRVVEICTNSHWRGLYRIAVTEAIRHTGVARDFHEAGPKRLTRRLTAFLRVVQEEGALASGDPHLLASQLLSPLLTAPLPGGSASSCLPMNAAARKAYVRSVVNLFCNGINGARYVC